MRGLWRVTIGDNNLDIDLLYYFCSPISQKCDFAKLDMEIKLVFPTDNFAVLAIRSPQKNKRYRLKYRFVCKIK